MSWYEEASSESANRQARSETIYRESAKAYEAVWNAMVNEMNQLRSRRQESLQINGSAFQRVVKQPISPRPGHNEFTFRELKFWLTADRTRITAIAPRSEDHGPAHIEFELERSADGLVRLTYDQAPIEIEKAAIMVLRHFLFPDLPLKRD